MLSSIYVSQYTVNTAQQGAIIPSQSKYVLTRAQKRKQTELARASMSRICTARCVLKTNKEIEIFPGKTWTPPNLKLLTGSRMNCRVTIVDELPSSTGLTSSWQVFQRSLIGVPLSGVASSARQDTIPVSPGISHNMNAGISLATRRLQTAILRTYQVPRTYWSLPSGMWIYGEHVSVASCRIQMVFLRCGHALPTE